MPKAKPAKAKQVRAALPGYSLADVLVLTSATKSNMQHWTTIGLISADMVSADGRGHHRRFSTYNVVEIELCAAINQFRVAAEVIRGATNIFRLFHIGAVALYEETNNVPFESSTIRVVTPGADGSVMPGRIGLCKDGANRELQAKWFQRNYGNHYFRDGAKQIAATAEEAATVWHEVRSGGLIDGKTNKDWNHLVALFINGEHRSAAEVLIDVSDLRNVIEGSAIVIDIATVVFRIGERCKYGFRLAPW